MILITFLLVVSTTFSVYARLDGCGTEDWTPYKDEKCIYISTGDAGSFNTIETFCAKKEKNDDIRSRILTVTTVEEQEFVTDLLFKKRNDIVNDIWLGAQYDEEGKDFRWRVDFGRGIELLNELDKKNDNFANWQEGEEPENNQNDINKNSCVELIGSGKAKEKGKWRTTLCSKTNIAVCEKPQVWSASKQQAELLKIQKLLPQKALEYCPVGWTPYRDEKCLKFFENEKTFYEAEDICIKTPGSQGHGNLVTWLYHREKNFLDYIKSKNVWFGTRWNSTAVNYLLRKNFGNGIVEIPDEQINLRKVISLFPHEDKSGNTNNGNDNNCIKIFTSEEYFEFKYYYAYCDDKLSFFCERPQLWSASKLQQELLMFDFLKTDKF